MTAPQPSPLGRYDSPGAQGQQLHEVRLLRVPVRLLAAGRAHHDELMHEFAVLAVGPRNESRALRGRLVELGETLGRRYGAAASRPDALLDKALADGVDAFDL